MLYAGKRLLKALIASGLYYTGVLHLYRALRLRGKAVVLMYHRVLPEDCRRKTFSHPGIVVDVETFDKQLQFISRWFKPLSLEQFAEHLTKGQRLPDSSCLVTFDDGWKDNFEHAFPVLKRRKVPAVIFLATDYIGTEKVFWQEHLSRMLWYLYEDRPLHDAWLEQQGLGTLSRLTRGGARASIRDFVSGQKGRFQEDVTNLMEGLFAYFRERGIPAPYPSGDSFLRWQDVKVMADDGISFGSHTASHAILPGLDLDAVNREVRDSRAAIEAKVKQEVWAFAYPNGDLSTSVADVVEENGYQVAFSTRRGFVAGADDRFTLRRVNIHEDSTSNIPMFYCTMLGVF